MRMSRKDRVRRRHLRVRRKVSGTAERPRLCIHKSLRHLYAQLVDDEAGRTLLFATTNCKEFKNGSEKKTFRNVESAKKLGEIIGRKAAEKGIRRVVFDRGGYRYHGCVKSFADAAREAGLEF